MQKFTISASCALTMKSETLNSNQKAEKVPK